MAPDQRSFTCTFWSKWNLLKLYTRPCNPGVISLILAWSHNFVEIDHEIISAVDSRRVVLSF